MLFTKKFVITIVAVLAVISIIGVFKISTLTWEDYARFDDTYHTDLFCNCKEYRDYQYQQQHPASSQDKINEPSSGSNDKTYGEKICGYCGKHFSGVHYTHLGKMADCHESSDPNSIGIFCSLDCCTKARKRSCPSCY